MSRAASLALFIAIALSLVGLAHYYVWARLVRDAHLSPGLSKTLSAALIFLFLSVPASLFLRRSAAANLFTPLVWVAFVWIGILFLLIVIMLLGDVTRLGVYVARNIADTPPLDPERRVTLARIFAGSVALLTTGLTAFAVRSGLGRVMLQEIEVRLSRLPERLAGTTIVQLTDMHVGPTIRRDFVEEIVAQVNAVNADVVAITGDLVDGSVADLRDHVAPLGKIRARYGVYFVTGNHEYYSGVHEWCEELTRLGIRVLRNERVSIGDDEASFDLAGVDDHQGGQFGNGHGQDVARAVLGRDPTRELVLLAHQPRAVFEAEKHGVGLQLSGHTHGGQIFPWNFLVRLQQPVVAGLERIGRTLVYVSRGTGYWGPPMRLAAPAEITKIVLYPERAATQTRKAEAT